MPACAERVCVAMILFLICVPGWGGAGEAPAQVVVPGPVHAPPDALEVIHWTSKDHPLQLEGVKLDDICPDLGVISSNDHIFLIARLGTGTGLYHVLDYSKDYSTYSPHVNLEAIKGIDPVPPRRLDAEASRWFGLTNGGGAIVPSLGPPVSAEKVWTVFDPSPALVNQLNPSENGKYFHTKYFDAPAEVCDDFGDGSYALFPGQLEALLIGTKPVGPPKSTRIKYRGKVPLIERHEVLGIDVVESTSARTGSIATLFVLSHIKGGGATRVSVFEIKDDQPDETKYDSVKVLSYFDPSVHVDSSKGFAWHDLELLPARASYHANPPHRAPQPVVALLTSWNDSGTPVGAIMLLDSKTGDLLESIGSLKAPKMTDTKTFCYMDVHDHAWQIHVTRERTPPKGSKLNMVATVFTYQ